MFSFESKYKPLIFYFLLLNVIIVLFLARTSTGILSVLLIVLCFWISLPLKRKITTGTILLILSFVGYFLVSSNATLMNIINTYLFNKGESESTLSRYGGTIALIKTWLANFFTGVGRNYHDYYIFKYLPESAKSTYEYIYVFSVTNDYPVLSSFLGWLAEYGTIGILFILFYVFRLLKDYRVFSNRVDKLNNRIEYRKIAFFRDSAHYFFVFYFFMSFIVFDWSESIFLIMFYFFVVVRARLREKLI